MYTIALLSACLLCLGGARRVQTTKDGAASDAKLAQALSSFLLTASPAAFQARGSLGSRAEISRNAGATIKASETAPDSLKALAKELNPVIGYFDPLKLGSKTFWGQSNEATVGFLRHAEIKHSRVAMAAFVGYLAQSNGIHFPWALTGGDNPISFKDIAAAGSPPEQWDALPLSAKLQIILFIGFLEVWGETSYVLEKDGLKHYMRGGEPGKYPSFNEAPHYVPIKHLWDPVGTFTRKGGVSAEQRAKLDKSLVAEINNGRLAMLGIMSFLAEQRAPGSVPFFKAVGLELKPYTGVVMDPFGNGLGGAMQDAAQTAR